MKAKVPKAHESHNVMLVEIVTFNILLYNLLVHLYPIHTTHVFTQMYIYIGFTKIFKNAFAQIFIYIYLITIYCC